MVEDGGLHLSCADRQDPLEGWKYALCRGLLADLRKHPWKALDGNALDVLLFVVQQFQIPLKQPGLLQVFSTQVLKDGLELLGDLLTDFKIEVLAHYCHLLCPAYRQLTAREIFYSLTEQVGAIDSSY